MEYFGKLFSSVSTLYNGVNPSTLSGCIDIIVVEREDGELACSPFHVRFGKLSVLMPQEKKVEIKVNGQAVPYVMKVGEAGEAFFIFETEHDVPEEYQTSPLLDPQDDVHSTTEDPPFLDIGQAKGKPQQDKMNTEAKDEFDDEERVSGSKRKVPLELQSPKMIIEEQVDKVVTHLDPSYHTSNDVSLNHFHCKSSDLDLQLSTNDAYPQRDGSLLLERVLSEPVSSTTVAKETFTVRPVDGDLDGLWMEVTRNSDDTYGITSSQKQHEKKVEDSKTLKQPSPKNDDPGHGSSIFLDIAGYKTEHHRVADASEATPLAALPSETTLVTLDVSPEAEVALTETKILDAGKGPGEHSEKRQEASNVNLWGWGQLYRGDNSSHIDNEEQQKQASKSGSDTASSDGNNEILVKPGQTYRIQVSLCGFSAFGADEEQNAAEFRRHQISFGTFIQNPNVLNDKGLVFKHQDRYYAADSSGPLFTSLLVFRKPLDGLPHYNTHQHELDAVHNKDTYRFGHGWRQWFSRSSVQAVATTPSTQAANTEKPDNSQKENSTHGHHHTTFTMTTKATTLGLTNKLDEQKTAGVDNHGQSVSTAEAAEVPTTDEVSSLPKRRNYAKTLRLTSEQLKSLPMKKGVNTISFSVTSAYQGTATCVAKLFLWDSNVKVVISDIDGTITKSDALGHVFTMIGKDWTHNGVAKLYTDIHHNGYQFLYLTSRAIGQSDGTRSYLKGVVQDDYRLPDGPVLMSPDRLFASFHREVIIRKPEMFKMGCLRDVKRLFGDLEPFYAGFGNRITDGVSYRSVDVPASRIFTIDPHGELKLELLLGFKSSYVDLNNLVDQMFPPLTKNREIEDQSFNDWNFWKMPLPSVDLPLPDIEHSSSSATAFTTTTTATAMTMTTTATTVAHTARINEVNNHSMSPVLPSSPPSSKPKPKPIVPDISALPKESVIDMIPTPSRRKRSILRRLTSRSSLKSSSSTSNTVTTQSSSSSLILPKKSTVNLTVSQSSPTISTDKAGTKQQQQNLSFELLDDDTFDATLDAIEDEIDMDSIPFI